MRVEATQEFEDWIRGLRDIGATAAIYVRISRIEASGQLVGDVRTIDGSLREMRFHTGAGYRVYFIQRGDVLVILLGGGDKSTQSRDIAKLLKQSDQWKGLFDENSQV